MTGAEYDPALCTSRALPGWCEERGSGSESESEEGEYYKRGYY